MSAFRVTLRFRLDATVPNLAPVLLALTRIVAALREQDARPMLTIEQDR